MILTYDNLLLLGSILLITGILATRTTRFGIPVLLLFLAVGMLAGSDGIGGIYFNDLNLSKFIGIMALSFILFSGGLDTRWNDIRPVLWQGISLSTIGVILTAVITGLLVWQFTGLSLTEGLLLGSIVSSTDAAAVFSILRSRSIGLKGNLRPLLELESGSNDAMAYLLTIFFTYMLGNQEASFLSLVPLFFKQMLLGGLMGVGMGLVMHRILNWIRLDIDGLYSVLLIALMVFTFSFTDFMGGNGFLAVYLAGCILGNRDFIHKKSLIKHFDGQAWFMQGLMFITLGLLVFPKALLPNIGIGLLISVILIVLARPAGVFLSLIFFRISLRKRFFISWVGLRGAVPIVLAIYPLTAGVPHADLIFNLVFFISITSVLLQGTTIPLVARWLGQSLPAGIRRNTLFDKEQLPAGQPLMTRIDVGASCPCIGRAIVDLQMGASLTVTSLERGGKFLAPGGSTVIRPGDRLQVTAADREALSRVHKMFGVVTEEDIPVSS